MKIAAAAAFGIEAVTARELDRLGFRNLNIANGRIYFDGSADDICRANIMLRTADRVLIAIERFDAVTFDELFEKTKSIPWGDWLPVNAAFPVNGKCVDSQLMSISDCQAIVKKAVAERLKQKYRLSWFDESGPVFPLEVSIVKDVVEITIDSSGAGLHKRGYRRLSGAAPLKETLAAALVLLSRWNADRAFVDPFCGSGTIAVEAAMIGLNIAPGIKRSFVSEQWPQIAPVSWQRAREEAFRAQRTDVELRISGFDIDADAVKLAKLQAENAGVAGQIHFQAQDVRDLRSRYSHGYIVCNPPYGERSGEIRQVESLYREMGAVFGSLDSWSYYILSAHPEFEKFFGRKADRKRKLFNGGIKCDYYQYYGPPPRFKSRTSG